MPSTAAASGALVGGAWFGELASALQGSWQAACEHRPSQQLPKLGGGGGLAANNNKKAAAGAGAGNKTATKKEDVVACGGGLSDATLCLLLDRFAPN